MINQMLLSGGKMASGITDFENGCAIHVTNFNSNANNYSIANTKYYGNVVDWTELFSFGEYLGSKCPRSITTNRDVGLCLLPCNTIRGYGFCVFHNDPNVIASTKEEFNFNILSSAYTGSNAEPYVCLSFPVAANTTLYPAYRTDLTAQSLQEAYISAYLLK